MPAGVSTYAMDVAPYNEQYIYVNGVLYGTVDYCGEYASYFLNSSGGIDFFLWEGKCKKTAKFDTSEYAKDYDNRTVEFGRMRYVNRTYNQYELTTGWLTEEEAERFAKNLPGTTWMYLHDLVSGEIFPVTVQDDSVEFKTRRTENGNLISYVLTVVDSQDRVRR